MLNVIVSGKTSQQLKSEYGVATNELIRDYLKKEHNEELLFLQEQNQVLLLMDMGFTERKNMLTKMHQVKFRNNELDENSLIIAVIFMLIFKESGYYYSPNLLE